jgi:hypothetical protein
MAKSVKKKIVTKSPKQQDTAVDISPAIEKYFWLVTPILTVIYFLSSRYSVGFYQDDEIAQYLNMLQFWNDPWVILGNMPKPGYKILMVVPALFGYDVVLTVNSFIAALTVFFTYKLGKAYKLNYAFVGALLLAFQPLFFDLSFRSYSEIFTALLVVIFLLLYEDKKYLWSALVCGYIFTVRQEIGLVLVVLAIIFIRKKEFVPAVMLFVFPAIYNLLGLIHTGDIMYVMTEMQKVAGLNYKSQGFLHYFKVYIFIVGPVCLTLFLSGFFGFLNKMNDTKEYFSKYLLLYVMFISVFGVQLMTMFNDGPNPGNWRYLLHISPVCAIFAVAGLNNLARREFRTTFLVLTGGLALLTIAFLSYSTDGFTLNDEKEYSKFLFILILMATAVMLWSDSKTKYLNNMSMLVVVLAIIYLFINFEPKELSAENIKIKEAAEFVDNNYSIDGKQVLSNHAFLPFYSKQYKDNVTSYKPIQQGTLADAPSGSIIVWETHYGYRPEWGNDVNIDVLINDSAKYKIVNQILWDPRGAGAYIFEKK